MTLTTLFDTPGLFTCNDGVHPEITPADFYGLGYRWIIGQAVNGPKTTPVDLAAYKAAGFSVGVWGVTYNTADFQRDGAALAAAATGYDLVVLDAEQCLKNADPWPLIRELAAFPGLHALSTLGAASGQYVFPIDYDGFVDAGYHILPQAYYLQTPVYAPASCYMHAARARISLHLVHPTVDSSDEFGPVNPHDLMSLLRITPCGKGFSVFLLETGPKDFYETLAAVTR